MSGKLVRDRIGDIPWPDEASKQFLRPVRGGAEHDRLLMRKLPEELGEFLTAETFGESLSEAADVLEVMIAIIKRRHSDMRHDDLAHAIASRARRRREEVGGFDVGTVFEVRRD